MVSQTQFRGNHPGNGRSEDHILSGMSVGTDSSPAVSDCLRDRGDITRKGDTEMKNFGRLDLLVDLQFTEMRQTGGGMSAYEIGWVLGDMVAHPLAALET